MIVVEVIAIVMMAELEFKVIEMTTIEIIEMTVQKKSY